MRVLISIEHPAWSWQFRKIIDGISKSKDDSILVLAVEKDGDTRLLREFGIEYRLMASSTGRNIAEKAYLFLKLCITYTIEALRFKPDIIIGRASPMLAITAFICKCPHLIFEDTEVSRFSLRICRALSTCIMTPEKFHDDLGRKQIRLPMYKELFYLHDDFKPDKESLVNTNVDSTKPYAVVRFISWNASHDVGHRGLSDKGKIEFISKLADSINVYITSEKNLPEELDKYKLIAPFQLIHQVLYFATVVISEGSSMASEAAMLGTHAFYLNGISSGTTEEQEKRFHLLKVLHDPKTRYGIALKETRKMIKNPDIWNEGKRKRLKILAQMPDPNIVYLRKMEELVSENGMER